MNCILRGVFFILEPQNDVPIKTHTFERAQQIGPCEDLVSAEFLVQTFESPSSGKSGRDPPVKLLALHLFFSKWGLRAIHRQKCMQSSI